MRAALWRFFGVREREQGRALFFVAVSSLVSLAQTLGLVGTEALLLSRSGAHALPAMFVAGSAVTVLGTLAYGVAVGAYRNDALLTWMLLGAALALGVAAPLDALAPRASAASLFCFWFVTQAVFLNHTWTTAGDYFDTPAQKRLFPLFAAGNSVGGMLGGAVALGVSAAASAEALIWAWALVLAGTAGLIRLRRRRLRRWGPLALEEADETSVSGLRDAVTYARGSALGRWLVVSMLGMTLAFFLAQYLYLGVLARAFPEAAQLAAFLGLFLALSNAVEIALELGPVPRLIQRLGVARANLVHPWLVTGSFAAFAVAPGLVTALFARAGRELFASAVAEPVRNLVYNALPFRFRGRMRAFLEGIVAHAGMTLAGGFLLLIPIRVASEEAGGVSALWVCALGAITALLYVLANIAVRREYVRALVANLRAGRLDLSEVGELGRREVSEIAALWPRMLADHGARPTRLDLEVAALLARHGIVEPLLASARHASPEVRAASVEALGGAPGGIPDAVLKGALADAHARVRLAALSALGAQAAQARSLLEPLLADPEPAVRAQAALQLGAAGHAVLEELARSPQPALRRAALERLPGALAHVALARCEDADPATRAAALDRLAELVRPVPLAPQRLSGDLSHPDVRVRRAAVRALATLDSEAARGLLATAFDDLATSVSRLAERALGAQGDVAIDALRPRLRPEARSGAEAALRTLGRVGSARARALLREQLRARIASGWRAAVVHHALDGFVPDPAGVAYLSAAWADAAERSLRLVFCILGELEDPVVMRTVDRVLRSGVARTRGDALEVLSNLADRDAALLLVLWLEDLPMRERLALARGLPRALVGDPGPPQGLEAVLELSRAASDAWIRRAALAYDAARDGDPAEEHAMERLLVLRKVPLFSQLSLSQLDEIDRLLASEHYVAGEEIYREGDPGDRLFVLEAGTVEVWKDRGTAQALRLATCEPVSCFGEMAVLDGSPRSASIVAAEDTRLLSLEGSQLRELILLRPEIAFDFFGVLTGRVRAADRRFADAVRSDPAAVLSDIRSNGDAVRADPRMDA